MCRGHKKRIGEAEASFDFAQERLGRSRGGLTAKLYARCDVRGRPLTFALTPGQAHDTQGFGPLIRMIADWIDALLADKGYDSDAVRDTLTSMNVEAVIPARRNRRNPAAHDRGKCRWRNQIERLFNKLKNWRRVATRYDKTAESYIGFVSLASVLLRLPFVHDAYSRVLTSESG
ncbi:IS5 family transposase [Sphingomonas sp. NCPPB 2930]|uniref:IS5 family transposase n=1 Tax=Sphingomonas sp. NCPPB 2930 TaxID=3162788 RepID=UPI0036DCEDBD